MQSWTFQSNPFLHSSTTFLFIVSVKCVFYSQVFSLTSRCLIYIENTNNSYQYKSLNYSLNYSNFQNNLCLAISYKWEEYMCILIDNLRKGLFFRNALQFCQHGAALIVYLKTHTVILYDVTCVMFTTDVREVTWNFSCLGGCDTRE